MDQENEHTKKLAAARGKLVDERRTVADALGKPYKKGHTENMRAAFVLVQNSIEAVDRALADERNMAGSKPVTAGPVIVTAPRVPPYER